MSNLLAARWQMAISLGFHIIFAVIGIALPLMMVIAEACWLRTGDGVYRFLARSWARGAAILFAVGAVSGTVLSFELGLLWPHFMHFAGPIIGLGFGLEGFAFFTEAIFLGIYIYGWDRVPPLAHWLAGVIVAVSGALSGVLVVSVNAWMNTPAGFLLQGKEATNIDPFAALWNPSMVAETLHMTLAAYAATGFMVAGVHAFYLSRDRTVRFHRRALAIALAVGGTAALLQPLSGDYSAKVVARTQPVKLAAMEGQFKTERRAPLRIGGWPNPETGETRFALEIPGALSLLAHNAIDAEVVGLNDVPKADRPPVRVVHLAFQTMVGCGSVMMGVALWGGIVALRKRRLPDGPWFLRAVVLASPLGMVAIEAGWTVTEVGRQPWIIQKIMRTTEAVTPVSGLWVSMVGYTTLYLMLGVVVVLLLRMQFRRSPGAEDLTGLADAESGK
ncbi:cytochrome bd-I ubiquinol oxidase subunit 1 apoprotein [Singulisphaera sp. GP187]|uniref:cytochrome ubiquinol oxidase subunit I n=1 Tax=Singulisphaera sp. GP187 TaxID=1882752 RepID=UPI0009277CD6|nr:cytochrome ubiquinol oxidase subunit I [Singulisphaera sp. GP187]SIN71998.1 cytochrome bd-I ubiquinol oxidase subunit 1 apoprotein [Singulisphaera sp. GP187]